MKSNRPTRSNASGQEFTLPYFTFRNISSPEDQSNNRKIGVGHAPLTSMLELPTNDNVRQYLVDVEGKGRKALTGVHKAIKNTLLTNSQMFSVLNGGMVIVATRVEVDEANKILKLSSPSIINGSQTQGVLRDLDKTGDLPDNTHIKFELIVTDDADVVSEVSIARNYQNEVASISIAGKRGHLDDLEVAMQKQSGQSGLRIKKSETDLADSFIDTEKLLQVIAALIPAELWPSKEDLENPNKVFTYSMKARCLKFFQEVYYKANEPSALEKDKDLYQFYLDSAYDAYLLYKKWKTNDGFRGSGIKGTGNHKVIRDEKGHIEEIPDGIIFPIISALSAFMQKMEGGWKMTPPEQFSEKELINAALTSYKEVAGGNPQVMGKTRGCYTALFQITSIYRRLFSVK